MSSKDKKLSLFSSKLLALSLLCVCGVLAACEPGGGDSDATADTSGSTSGSTSGGGTSGGENINVSPDDRQHTAPGQSWTFMVYLLGDTDLEPFALQDLQEMMTVGSDANVNIIVLVDRSDQYASDPIGGLGDFDTAKIVRVEAGTLTEIEDRGEINMGDPATLAEFIEYGVKNYPADHYVIDFWDHGGAWPGFGPDESHNDVLSLPEIRQGLQDGLQRAGIPQFTIIGFDACLMATYEVAFNVRDLGEYLLASEELEPGHGWNYEALQVIKGNPSASAIDLGRSIIDGFQQQAQTSGTVAEITLSLVDLYELEHVEAAAKLVNQAIGVTGGDAAAALAAARQSAIEYGANPDPSQATHMIDMGDFINKAAAESASLAAARDQINAALPKAVIYKVQGELKDGSTGLSVYWPTNASFYNTEYDSVENIDIWRANVKGKGEVGASIPQSERPVFINPNKVADVTADPDTRTLTVSGQLAEGTAQSAAYAILFYAVVENGIVYGIGDSAADISESGLVSGAWDTTLLTLSQNGQDIYAYLSLTFEGDNLVASIPFTYVDPQGAAQDVLLVIGFDAQGNEISSTYYAETGIGFGELVPEVGSLLYPLVLEISDQGSQWVESPGEGLDPNQDIAYSVTEVPSGENIYLELNVYDYGDNSDYVSFSGAL